MGIRTLRQAAAIACVPLAILAASTAVRRPPGPPSAEPSPRFQDPLWTISGLKKEIAARKAETRRLQLALGKSGPKKARTGWLEARLWYLEQRAGREDSIDWSKWQAAAEHRDLLPAANFGRPDGPGTESLGARWSYVGPNNLNRPYRRYFGPAPVAGRVSAVAFDPVDSNTYWVGGPGGLCKTTDAGVTWRVLSDRFPVVSISSIAIHPTNPDIVYVGTGDFDGAAPYGTGLMKSTNGGLSWTKVIGTSMIGEAAISAIVIDPDNPNIVIACSGRGGSVGRVWRSTDGGASWSPRLALPNAAWSDLDISLPNASGVRTYYLVGHSASGEFFRSIDQGLNWFEAFPPLTGPQNSLEVAASPVFENRVFVISGSDRKIWVSDSRGLPPWSEFTSGLPSSHDGDSVYNWSQASYDVHLTATNFGSTEMIYAGLITLARADILDGSVRWLDVGRTYGSESLLHNDQHAMAVHPVDPNLLLVGNDGGAYRLIQRPVVGTWAFTSLNKKLPLTQFYHFDAHPTDPKRLVGGTQDNASPAARGDLTNWSNPGGGDGGWCAIHPLNGNVQYVTSQRFGSLYRTKDGWSSKKKIATTSTFGSDKIAFIPPIAVDPRDARILYAGTDHLNRYVDLGLAATWQKHLGSTKLANDFTDSSGRPVRGVLTVIGVAPSDSNRIYTGANSGEVWMTKDAGKTWTQIDAAPLPDLMITGIAVHPTVPNILFVTVSGTGTGHVWRCDNAGSSPSWHNISGTGGTALPDVPANDIELDPDEPTASYYVATDVGVFYTTNFGVDWANATAPLGLPNIQVNDLKAVPATRTLYAATWGRGIWKISLPETLAPAYISAPAYVAGGASATGEVGLNGPAPNIGAVVALSSNNAAASVPASVKVLFGKLAATFPITTTAVTSGKKVTLSASRGGVTKQVDMVVNPAVKSVTFTPAGVPGGATATGKVTLAGPSLIKVRVAVVSENPSIAQIVNSSGAAISTVTVAAGASSAAFFVKTAAVAANTEVPITARYGGIAKTGTLTVTPPRPNALDFSPSTVAGGGSTTGTVTLSAAPLADTTVTLAVISGGAAVKTIPASVVVPAGAASKTFSVVTKAVASRTFVIVRATANGGSVESTFEVAPPVPVSLTFSPNPCPFAASTTGRVTLSAAPATNTVVTLRILSNGHAIRSMPSSVTVPAGATFVEFTVQAEAVSTDTPVGIEASANGGKATTTLTVRGPIIG